MKYINLFTDMAHLNYTTNHDDDIKLYNYICNMNNIRRVFITEKSNNFPLPTYLLNTNIPKEQIINYKNENIIVRYDLEYTIPNNFSFC